MNHKTHRSISKIFYPDIPAYKIDKINSAIDNPSKRIIMLQNSGIYNPGVYDVFGLRKHGHRKDSHDVTTAAFNAFMVDRERGVELAMTHLLADKMSNYMIDTLGTENKEIMESLINKWYTLYKESNLGIKKRTKRMFY